jgi:hypothetical protein
VNWTADIEWEVALVLNGGPLTLDELEQRLPAAIRDIGRRWIGVAVYRMLGDGRIRAVGCDHGTHDGACVVEAAR